MRTYQWECSARTVEPLDFVDLTDEIEKALTSSGIDDGQVTVFCPHTSCSLVVNERESGLLSDTRAAVRRMREAAPKERGAASDGPQNKRAASDGPQNKTSMIGAASIVLPAVGGRLRLGSWQRVLLVEWERGTDRSIVVQIVGE